MAIWYWNSYFNMLNLVTDGTFWSFDASLLELLLLLDDESDAFTWKYSLSEKKSDINIRFAIHFIVIKHAIFNKQWKRIKYWIERANEKENVCVCALTSSESEEVVLSFDGPVFFRLILSVELDLAKKEREKKNHSKWWLLEQNYKTPNDKQIAHKRI